jgi:solute:Na+ symporter, SSS family
MMWGLCFKAEMATTNAVQIERAEKETHIVVKEA